MSEALTVITRLSALTFVITNVLVMVMLIAILGLVLLMLVAGEMGKRMPAAAPTTASAASGTTS